MCSIVHGKASDGVESECLFVHTFTVEEVPGALLWVQDIWKRRVDENFAFEREFVRVVVKDRYVYKTDAQMGRRFTRTQACFL